MVRAKFYVTSITYYNGGSSKVELWPVYSQEEGHENKRFWDATPSGKLEMTIKSDAAKEFILGEEYYIDFTLSVKAQENLG